MRCLSIFIISLEIFLRITGVIIFFRQIFYVAGPATYVASPATCVASPTTYVAGPATKNIQA
jgi:hypothetical protein